MRQITIAFTLVVLTTGVVRGEQVVVTPEETDEILANPGMGWASRHRPHGSRVYRLVGGMASERIEEVQTPDSGKPHEGGGRLSHRLPEDAAHHAA